MGQYSALVAAGALTLDDGVRLVRERGRLMQASGQGRDGAMAAIIGLDDATTARAGRGCLRARRLRRRQPQRPGPGRRVGRAPGHRGGCRDREVPRRQAGDRPAGVGRGPLPAHERGGRRDARGARRRPVRGSERSRSSPTPTPTRSRRPTPAGPSSSNTSQPASTGSVPSSRCPPPASPPSSRSVQDGS